MRASPISFGFRRSVAVALGMSFVLVLASAPAQAQFLGYWGWRSGQIREIVPPSFIYRRLRARGYRVLSALQRNGGVYLADVRDRRGHRQRLVIDAYSGAVLQSFVFGPPRPAVGIPGSRRSYREGPTYASRYPPEIIAPVPIEPRTIPAPTSRSRSNESRIKRKPRRLARREVAPAKPELLRRHEPLASHATRAPLLQPAPAGEQTPAHSANTHEHSPSAQKPATQKASLARHEAETAAVPAVKTPSSSGPAASAQKRAPKAAAGPGYANGVPINPLD